MKLIAIKDHPLVKERQAWSEYVELAAKAQETRDFADCLQAGQAWGRFVYLFCGGKPK